MKVYSILCIAVIIWGKPTWSEELPAPKNQKTAEAMSVFLNDFLGLKKFLASDDEFLNPQNAPEISQRLKDFATAIKKTRHDPNLLKENFKFSRESLESHVSETERVFRLGNKAHARWMLDATIGLCMSCHTQMPTTARTFSAFLDPKFFSSDFDRAEFSFATKDFEYANQIFKNLVMNYPAGKIGIAQLETSVQRQLTYTLRVRRDLKETRKLLREFIDQQKLPDGLVSNLKSWDKSVAGWQKSVIPDVGSTSADEVLKFAQRELAPHSDLNLQSAPEPQIVVNLFVSGLLYEYLQRHPDTEKTPEILYWLSVADREADSSFSYTLADLYLRECITRFPASVVAPKCYKEYEAETVLGYTGSRGTSVPPDVKRDLEALKRFVDAKGKIPLKGQSQ